MAYYGEWIFESPHTHTTQRGKYMQQVTSTLKYIWQRLWTCGRNKKHGLKV